MKKTLPLSLFFILTTFASNMILAQNPLQQTIRGTVVDKASQLPLPGATIVVLNTNPIIGTATDAQGEFNLGKINVGRVAIKVSYIGYHPVVLPNLNIISGKELVLRIELEEQVITAEPVEIVASSKKDEAINRMASVSSRSFSVEQTERYAGSLGDPSRMAANYAGVSNPSDQRNDIVIRGNSPLGLLWRIDGVEVPNPNHFGSLASTGGPVSILNNNTLANSDFFTGAFPAEFGNAMAGVFDLKLRNGNDKKREFTGQVGFNGFELGTEGPFRKKSNASYLASFRYSTLEVFNMLGMDVGTGAAVPQYKDVTFKINVPTAKYGKFSLFGVGGTSYIEMLDSKKDSASYGFSGTDLKYGSDMSVLGINHVYFLTSNDRITSTVSVCYNRNTTDLRDLSYKMPGVLNVIEDDEEIKYSASVKYSRKINARNYCNMGLVYDFYQIDYFGKVLDTSYTPDKYIYFFNSKGEIHQGSSFAEWQYKFNDKVVLNTGIRGQYLFLNQTGTVEGRAGIRWNFAPTQTLSLGTGMHSQPQLKALYFIKTLTDSVNQIYEQTNRNLKYSKSLHFVLGYDILLSENQRLKTEAYYQYLYHIPISAHRPEYSGLNQGGNFTYWAENNMENKGTGENIGLELTLEKFLNKGFYYLFTASLFNSTYKGYDKVKRNTNFNNNYVVNLLAGYEWNLGLKKVLAIDVKVVTAGGKPYIPINETQSALENKTVYDWDNAYKKRFNPYFRLNSRITFRLNGKKANQEWALDLQNMTNHKNIFIQNWDNAKKKVVTAYQQSFMPMMTYKIYF